MIPTLSAESSQMKLRTSGLVAAFALASVVNLGAAEHYDVQIERAVGVGLGTAGPSTDCGVAPA